MKKIYYLSSCTTCKRILDELRPPASYVWQDIKEEPVTAEQLEELRKRAGSYEALFSKRARLFRERGLDKKDIDEAGYKKLLLDHYTFLKRPVILSDDNVFIGNSPKTVSAAKATIHS